MKSEAEIRAHIESLRTCQKIPCDCKAVGHEFQCKAGGMMMKAVEETLMWALGENPRLEEQVCTMALAAKDYKASLN